jgi:hypothetical protein
MRGQYRRDRSTALRNSASVHALVDNDLRVRWAVSGACGDNAAIVSFIALIQRNILDRQRWSTRAQLRRAIVTWIEKTYHRKRRQRRLGRPTPIEFETHIAHGAPHDLGFLSWSLIRSWPSRSAFGTGTSFHREERTSQIRCQPVPGQSRLSAALLTGLRRGLGTLRSA